MTGLVKATLQVLELVKKATHAERADLVRRGVDKKTKQPLRFEVQLNPTSLRLQRQNNVDRGAVTTGHQRRQGISSERSTLSFDLEFDVADEFPLKDVDQADDIDVRHLTKRVRQFVEPPPKEPKKAPPRVELQWGTFIFDGIMTQIVEELDYFSPEGRPLRAKLSITIEEQDLRFEKGDTGPAARNAERTAPPGGSTNSGPGGSGTAAEIERVAAQAGESVQALATRIGGNPTAWRSLMNGLDSPLNLPAGTMVAVGPELDSPGGVARAAGFGAGQPPMTPAALASALDATASAQSGFTLAKVGGVGTAAAVIQADGADRATVAARAAFSVPPAGRRAGSATGVDPRALSYGSGVPLAARADLSRLLASADTGRDVAARARPADVPVGAGSTRPPWRRPSPPVSRAHGSAEQRVRDAPGGTMPAAHEE